MVNHHRFLNLLPLLLTVSSLASLASGAGYSAVSGKSNKECKTASTIFRKQGSDIQECADYCASVPGCEFFAAKSGNNPWCEGCKSADSTDVEYDNQYDMYKLDSPNPKTYGQIQLAVKCHNNDLIGSSFAVTSIKQCGDACAADASCKTFSVSVLDFSPLAGGTCRLCDSDFGFSSDSDYITYSKLQQAQYEASIPYVKFADNKECKSDATLFKEQISTNGAKMECYRMCESIQGCTHFALKDGNNPWCEGCNAATSSSSTGNLEYDNQYTVYDIQRDTSVTPTYTLAWNQKECSNSNTIGSEFDVTTREQCLTACKNDANCKTFSVKDMKFDPIGGGKCRLCKSEWDFTSDSEANVYYPTDPDTYDKTVKVYQKVNSDRECRDSNIIYKEQLGTYGAITECSQKCLSIPDCKSFSLKEGSNPWCKLCDSAESAGVQYDNQYNHYGYKTPVPEPAFQRIGHKNKCNSNNIIGSATQVASQAACQALCANEPLCKAFTVSDMKFAPFGGGECTLCDVDYNFDYNDKYNTYSTLSPAAHAAAKQFSYDFNDKECKDSKMVLKEQLRSQYGAQEECNEMCQSIQGCTHFSVKDGSSPWCKGCDNSNGDGLQYDNQYKSYTISRSVTSWPYTILDRDVKCHNNDLISPETDVTSQLECHNLCKANADCLAFSVSDMAWDPINGGKCRLCSSKWGFSSDSNSNVYLPVDQTTFANSIPYTYFANDKECKDSKIVLKDQVSTHGGLWECAAMCESIEGCTHFSLKDGSSPWCKGCDNSNGDALQYDNQYKAYSIVVPPATEYGLIGREMKCHDSALIGAESDVTSQEECYNKCKAEASCVRFSVSDMKWDPIGGGKCRLCNSLWGFSSNDESNIYAMSSLATYKANIPYAKHASDKECKTRLFSQQVSTNFGVEECYNLCHTTDGCTHFDLKDGSNPWCHGCDSTAGTLMQYDNQYTMYSTDGTGSSTNSNAPRSNTAAATGPVTGECIGPTGVVWGDPHFITYDKKKYDCQGRGEFVITMTKDSDPLQIHGRYTDTGGSRTGPSVMRSIAIKVVGDIPALQVTIPDMPEADGSCPYSYSVGPDEDPIPASNIVTYFSTYYPGRVNIYKSTGKVVIHFPETATRIELITKSKSFTKFGCRMRSNICVTPQNHGGASNFVGMLGTPNNNQSDDIMESGPGNPLTSFPGKKGNAYCLANWCVSQHSNGSMYTAATHAKYNQCIGGGFDPAAYEQNLQLAISLLPQTVINGCSTQSDPEGCVEEIALATQDTDEDPEQLVTVLEEEETESEALSSTKAAELDADDTWESPPVVSTSSAVVTPPPDGLVPEIVYKVKEEDANPVCKCKAYGWGDPHIVTFDGVLYDVHVKGEMIFLKSLQSDFTIQARTQIVSNHWRGPAVTTGVVVKEDSTKRFTDAAGNLQPLPKIQVSMAESSSSTNAVVIGRCPIHLFVDGQSRDITTGSGTDGAYVQVKGRKIVVEYPTTKLQLVMQVKIWRNTCHFSIRYNLLDCRCNETLVGILGQPDGKYENDWHNHTGYPEPIPPSRRDRVTKPAYDYSLTWCIYEESKSEFTYESAERGYDFFYNCTQDNYDNTLADVIDNPTDAHRQKCTVDGVLHEECLVECGFMEAEGEEEGACDEFVEELKQTKGAIVDIPEPPPTDPEDASPSGSKGDPHFKSWSGEHFEFHGQCDLVLTKDEGFADGLGLDVQIRTKLVRYWSYIRSAAIRIGSDVLEVHGTVDLEDSEPKYWFNLEHRSESAATIGGFPLTIHKGVGGGLKHKFIIDLSSKYPGQKILIATMKEFVKVDFLNPTADAFGNTVGMLGEFETGNLLGRDGKTALEDYVVLGNEWQVLPSDYMLFHSVEDPQFPKRCVLPEDPQGQRRRRLGESTISMEEAEAACAKTLKDAADIKDCVYDILATQDLDMVGAF